MPEPLKILLLEDSIADAELVAWQLNHAKLHHDLKRVETRDEFLAALESYAPDVILSDHTMPRYDGMSALKDTRETRPATPFIFVSGTLGESRAVESLKQGASDYVIKGDLMRLPPAIERALEEKKLRRERKKTEQLLRASEAKFKLLAEQAPVGIVLADAKGRLTFCNKVWADIAGRGVDEILAMDPRDLLHPEDKERATLEMVALLHYGQSHDSNYRMVQPSGDVRWVAARGTGQFNGEGRLFGFIGLLTDTTEQRLAEQKIVRLSRIQQVLSGINSTIVRVNDREQLCRDACRIAVDKGKFRMAWIALIHPETAAIQAIAMAGADPDLVDILQKSRPKSLTDLSPHSRRVMESKQPLVVKHLAEANELSHLLDALEHAEILSLAYLPICLADRVFGVIVLCSEINGFFTDEEMRLLDELTEDIAFAVDHLDKTERVNYLAYFDSLTELPNRTLFIDHLKQQVLDAGHHHQQISVMVINLEHFRHINESFGENAGDILLKDVARRLVDNSFHPGHLGRLGGDSFGVMAPNVQSIDSLFHMVERFVDEWLSTPFNIAGQDIVVPLHIGIAVYPSDGKDAETLFQNANAALKQAKSAHERISFYAEEINAQVSERLQFESRLRNAVEQEEFVLYYQPKVDLKTGRIGGMEALMRWNDPEHGLIMPGEFIPLLEETGLIYDMGIWALQRAFNDHAKLRNFFSYAPYIAVNVSALQLRRKTFYGDVINVIGGAADGKHGVDIEITESLIMHDIEDNIRKLEEVRNHDVHIAVDDFGTGYSSLSYIAKLPIDVLKIDRSFIIKMSESEVDLAIVSAIITLAHSLNLRVVAEGVETEEQAQMLRMLECDEAQGYLFCKPLPLDKLVQRLTMADDIIVLKN